MGKTILKDAFTDAKHEAMIKSANVQGLLRRLPGDVNSWGMVGFLNWMIEQLSEIEKALEEIV